MTNQSAKYRKFLAGAASAALVATAIVPTALAAEVETAAKEFSDVAPTHTHYGAIKQAVERGLFNGYTDGTFKPENTIDRKGVVKSLANYVVSQSDYKTYDEYISANKLVETVAPFNDVPATHGDKELFNASLIVKDSGIFRGSNNNLMPANNITRQQMAQVLVKGFGLEDLAGVESKVTDNAKAQDQYVDYINILSENGVTAVTSFNPTTDVKRGQMASFLNRSFDVAHPEVDATPEVISVSAVNGTQVEVTFNKAVDAKSLFTDGVSGSLKSGVVSIRSIDSVADGTLTGELSQDEKVLTVTSTKLFEKRYDVVVDKLKTTTGTDVEKFSKIISIDKDVTAPSILGTERITATQVKVKFSEPMASAGSVTFKLSDGTTVSNIAGHGSLVDGGKAIVLDLSNDSVPVNKDITATIIGGTDKAGNLLNPNPATVTFQKGDKDGVAPTVSSVTQTGATTFEIVFSEAIVGKPTVSIDNAEVNAANIVIDSKDATKVKVTTTSVLDGDKIITITGAVDGSGEVQATTNRVVKFVKDTVAPVLVSSAIVVDTTDRAEYLEFTFDKNVKLLSNATVDVTGGSYVNNHVTTTLVNEDIIAKSVEYKDVNNKKVVRVKLTTLLGGKSVEGAQYSVNLAFSGITSEAGEAITTGIATFTRGQDGTLPNTNVVALASSNAIVQSLNDNSVLVVSFDKAVDAATATNTANYIVGGAVVESAKVNATDLTKVTLKLKADSNTFSGVRNVTVQNVKAAGSTVAMATTTKAVDLKENVAPTVTAQLQADLKTIKLTFSENVYQTADNTVDFGVLEGTDAQSQEVVFEADSGLTVAANSAVNTISIELPTKVTATQLSKSLSLKALSTIDITDAEGNKLSVPANITISNN